MNISRIPNYEKADFESMSTWFSRMSEKDLLFHPDDLPEELVSIETGSQFFTADESKKLNRIIEEMFQDFGDAVYEAIYPYFMENMKKVPCE